MPRAEIQIEHLLIEKLSEAFYWLELADQPPKANQAVANDEIVAARIVARVSGLTIRIWADEHPPPHFHVSYQGQDASFSIIDCSRLTGSNGLERYERTIREWWRDNTVELIESWNASRPTHCPVGPVQLAGVKDSLRSSSTANMSDLKREMENLLKKLRLGSGS